jgi:hypothetical protein
MCPLIDCFHVSRKIGWSSCLLEGTCISNDICILINPHIYVSSQEMFHYPCIRKIWDWVDNEKHAYKNKHSLRSNTKSYGGKTH